MREQDILRFLANESSGHDCDDSFLIDHELLELCRKFIKKNITTLKDIPFELANTIANIYYKLCLLTKVNIGAAAWFPKFSDLNEDFVGNSVQFIKTYNKLKADLISIPDFVKCLREFDRNKEPELYNYSVEYVIDCLKYDIENINYKSYEQRVKERNSKKNKIREISNLNYILDI